MIGCEDHWRVASDAIYCTVHGTVARISGDEYDARARLRDACIDVDSAHLTEA